MIDSDGFRPNVGIIIANSESEVLWARRATQDAWQFPQGGLQKQESPQQAMYRELYEEVGLKPQDVNVLAHTRNWLRYWIPPQLVRKDRTPVCIGQKQKWFLLQLTSSSDNICLNRSSSPEFDSWKWVDYWLPARQVVYFKREVYRKALRELAHYLPVPPSSRSAQG
ncbi:MAG: RNA pyrophosphohydrolase [Kistimonas sp.]|nr:RNA pyrophosphohydrolase [Kistimonas sp.]